MSPPPSSDPWEATPRATRPTQRSIPRVRRHPTPHRPPGWTPRPVHLIMSQAASHDPLVKEIGTDGGRTAGVPQLQPRLGRARRPRPRAADALCDRGIDVILDRYVHPTPAEGWPRWMERNLDAAQFVLMVCTETYRRRVRGEEEPGQGTGVRWEGSLICNRIAYGEPGGIRFIPILLPGAEPTHIPEPVRGHNHYRLAIFDLTDPATKPCTGT